MQKLNALYSLYKSKDLSCPLRFIFRISRGYKIYSADRTVKSFAWKVHQITLLKKYVRVTLCFKLLW